MGTAHRARAWLTTNMKLLLVCCVLASASAAPQLLGYPYGYGLGAYPYAVPNIIKPVPKEIEDPYTTIEYVAAETGCTNSFGAPVPCARRRRDADEEAAEEPAAAVPAVLPYGLPYGLGLGLPYASPLTYSVATPAIKPTVTEVEVPQYKFVLEVKKVELLPACHNAWGFPVPCAV